MIAQPRFGAFFRARRNALGLSLREFCRQSGLDPGNISRLERGLLPPPRSPDILLAYATALKLAPKSHDWETLQALAIQENLPKGILAVRKKPRHIEPWVNATDIETWADLISARTDFPRLIRRLIHATSEALLRAEFPAGEGSQRSGWDGIVTVPSSLTPHLPAGVSCWELGVGATPARKAENDFRTRTKNSLGIQPNEATFVFATARRWAGKAKWESEKNRLGIWKEVRVLDADSLEAWLELAPAVDTWFARLLGKRTEGMLDLDEYWHNLAAMTEPRLTPSIFLASRRSTDVSSLENWLGIHNAKAGINRSGAQLPATATQASALAIESSSPADAIDFLAAYVANIEDTNRDALSSRIVIVEDAASWNILCDHQHSLTLVAKPSLALEAEAVSQAVRKGHRVLLASDRFTPGQFQSLKLSRPEAFQLGNALIEAGFDEQDARKHALDCSGSLTVLKRRLSRVPATTEPAWSRDELADQIAPLVLIGCWEDASIADNELVSQMLGKSYADVASLVRRAATLPDPPLFRVRGLCSLTSREDSWFLLARRLHDAQLDTWQEFAVRVLTSGDIADKPRRLSRRSKATLQGFSESLRTGIAETLVLLEVFPKEIATTRPADFLAEHVVQRVLGDGPGCERWAALGRQLPLLAEAAPNAFLNALKAELRAPGSDILQLFSDGGDSLFSPCLHAGLLWALETLAWHPQYLLPVSLILAELAERDTGKQWANRPANSLVEIFLSWLPHTAARVDERIRVLRKITEKRPMSGWRLLLALMPSLQGHSTPTRTPKWRNWAMNWRAEISDADFAKQVQACGDRLIEMVGADVQRWADLISHITNLPPMSRQSALSTLANLDLSGTTTDERTLLTEKLRVQIQRHRAFQDAPWALPPEDVAAMDAAMQHVEPNDPIARSAWLFAQHVELPEPHGEGWSRQTEEKKISAMRQEAIAAILAQDGMTGLSNLAAAVKAPWLIGVELSNASGNLDLDELLPSLIADPNPALAGIARGYAGERFKKQAWNWVAGLSTDCWTAEQLASLATVLPAERRTWDLLEQHSEDATRIYWESASAFWIREQSDIRYAISQLLSRRLPFAAIRALEMAHMELDDLPADLLLETLQATLEPDADNPPHDIAFTIIRILQNLQHRQPPVDEKELAQLEWAYIDLLDGEQASALTLHKAMASDARFFSELVQRVFRPRNDRGTPTEEPTDQERNRAKKAYGLLHSWQNVPGFQPAAQTIDGDALRDWVELARQLCRESGHLEICDVQIGEILSHAPKEPDGTWPCIPVRDVIEAIDSQDIEDGFVIGTLNQQGVTIRMPTDGGTLERAEASTYASYAEASQSEWPVTARILRRITATFESRARDEDADAEVRRLGR